ncbi:MAG: gliding motility-associated C-terminal domain-containing protein [Candidatus Onthomorpha sp.]|nr:gliding motility-associated C-terminal domain-containing protein [Bacteroidales bacterium]MDY5825131.1 gliding motility-associated C-terminal domain-containing protein [Candidatus Onthomorpha sp.]
MKKIILFCVSVFMLAVCGKVSAQEYLLNNTNHNKTKNTCSGYLYDNSKNGNYEANQDRWITICPPASTGNTGRISLTFEEFDIHPTDTVFIYQGTSINDPYMTTSDNVPFFQNNDLLGRTIMPSLMMPSGCLTVRLASDGSNEASGFKAKIECASLCQYPEAALDEMFYRVAADGTLIPRPVRDGADTSINEDGSLNIVRYKSVDFCFGDSVVLVAKPLFPENDNVYHQDASTCIYEWSFGDGQTATVNYNTQVGHRWEDLSGYDLMLVVEDTANGGCRSRNVIDTRVRMATNPIKTVQQMPDMCSGTEVGFTVGYGENSQIIVDSLDFRRGAKERYENTVFIPDGPNCYNLSPTGCYDAPVTFDQFPSGSTVGSGSDVMSVCINMEHTFLGDLGFTLVCPNGQSVILKYNTHSGGSDLGLATSSTSCSNQCDSNCNPPGVGWTYCFSNQYLTNARGVINGNMSSPIDSTNTVDTTGYFQTPVQNATSMATGWETVDLNGFQSLVGCPLNGEWSVRICDDWGADNGYVFWWDLELGQNSAANWDYQVPIDTVIWSGPTFFSQQTSTSSIIAPPIDSVGTFVFDVSIIDDFGCQWDTVSPLTVVQTPVVNLGEDIALCEMTNVQLDAGNESPTATYIWSPTGETTRVITAEASENSASVVNYKVLVTEYNGSIYCYGQDDINLIVRPAANAAFTSDVYPLEGCEPFSFRLLNTATNATQFEWTVGEETSTEADPAFTFPYGTYDVKLKVTSEYGCQDSVSYPGMINVYKHPIADFGWEPNNPYASDPTANLVNLTKPDDATNQYHWTVQTNRNNSNDVENLFGTNPSYTWTPQSGQSVAGDYLISLDAYSVNQAPSGFIYECHDTISRIITIINDNLMFPTVVTPNGDGVNDVFTIHNLVEGQAFPDNELSIYNRYGKRIYFVQDIRNESDFWDPAATNTPSGTYFYRFIGRGPIRDVEFKGSVEIIR